MSCYPRDYSPLILPRSTMIDAFGSKYKVCGVPSTVDLAAGPSGFA
jgi:hypothetical protein